MDDQNNTYTETEDQQGETEVENPGEVAADKQAMAHFGKKLSELSDEEVKQLNEIVEKYREKLLVNYRKQLSAARRQAIPKSYYTKKGPGKGKRQKRNRNR